MISDLSKKYGINQPASKCIRSWNIVNSWEKCKIITLWVIGWSILNLFIMSNSRKRGWVKWINQVILSIDNPDSVEAIANQRIYCQPVPLSTMNKANYPRTKKTNSWSHNHDKLFLIICALTTTPTLTKNKAV